MYKRLFIYCCYALTIVLVYSVAIYAQSTIIVNGHGAVSWPLLLRESTDVAGLLDTLPDRIVIDRAEIVRHIVVAPPDGILPPTPIPTTVVPTDTPTDTPTSVATTPAPTVTPTDTPTSMPTPPSDDGDPYEADDKCEDANPITTDSVTQSHTFHQPSDVDWVRFPMTADTTYRIEVAIPDGSKADVKVGLYGQCDTRPADEWDETFAPGAQLDFLAPADGPLYVRIQQDDDDAPVGENADLRYTLSVRELPPAAEVGAVIIVAGQLSANDSVQRNIYHVSDQVYRVFQAQGYTNENIYYIAANENLLGRDAAATKEDLEYAITEWAPSIVGTNRPLTLYFVDHGNVDEFYLDGATNTIVTPADLNRWLTAFEQAVPTANVNIIMEACFIGSFIEQPSTISKPNRVVITSSDSKWSAYTSRDGAHFSDYFLTALLQGRNLFSSFDDAQRAVNLLFAYQNPWLDANGNNRPNEQGDFAIAAERGFAYAGTLNPNPDNWPPFIANAAAPTTIVNAKGLLTAEVRDDRTVDSVWAVVYAPSYVPPASDDELLIDTAPTLLLTAQGNDRYAVEYPAFNETGTYRIVFYARDQLGNISRPAVVTTTIGNQLFLPIVVR